MASNQFNQRQMLIAVAAAVVVAAGALYYYVSRPETLAIGDTTGAATATSETPAAAISSAVRSGPLMEAGPLGEMALGDPNAPNVVIEYASMTCPHCQQFHTAVFRPFKEKYIDTGKVYFLFREFPLDPLATSAIMLARCAPADRAFPLVDLLFDHQREWAFVPDPVAALRDLVRQAGFTQESFQACLTNQSILDGVNAVKNRGANEFGVDSTPTFFINGEKRSGGVPLEEFDRILGG